MDGPATKPTSVERPVKTKTDSMMDKPPEADLPVESDTEIMPLIIIEDSSVVEKPKTTDGPLPIGSEILLPRSPEMASFEDRNPVSVPLSPNWVREGHSEGMPAEGSIFDVAPDLPGFNMRPAGGGLQPAEITPPPPSTYVNFNDPFSGAPIAFAQCHKTPGMDTPMTLPIYNIPQDGNIGLTAEDIIRDIDHYGYARLLVPHDIVYGDSTGGCRCNIWATTPPPPVSGVHWSSGVGEIIEQFTIVLGEPLGSGVCYSGGRQPAERCRSHDVESLNSGTVRDVVASDVVGNYEYWC